MGLADGSAWEKEFGHTYDTVDVPMKAYLPAWYEAYVISQEQDKHTVFMELTGLTRHEAKKLCYMIAYSVYESDVVQAYVDNKGE